MSKLTLQSGKSFTHPGNYTSNSAIGKIPGFTTNISGETVRFPVDIYKDQTAFDNGKIAETIHLTLQGTDFIIFIHDTISNLNYTDSDKLSIIFRDQLYTFAAQHEDLSDIWEFV